MRNFILSAVLFLIAGVASASVVYEEDTGNIYYQRMTDHDESRNLIVTVNRFKESFVSYELYDMDGTSWSKSLDAGTNHVTLPESVYKVGILAVSNDNQLILDSVKSQNAEQVYTYGGSTYDYGYYEFNNVWFGNGGKNIKDQINFGAPLPTPVITLLIALGFGAAFVMYRNRKQAKA